MAKDKTAGTSKGIGSGLIEIVRIFEGLIRRNIAPSLGFFALLAAADLIIAFFADGTDPLRRLSIWLQWFNTQQTSILICLFLLVLVGLSYVLAALHQVLYDDRLRHAFNARAFLPGKRKENRTLDELRTKVMERLTRQLGWIDGLTDLEGNDYLLYEVLGGFVPLNTRDYVDRAKAIGITAISAALIFVLLALGLVRSHLAYLLLAVPVPLVLWAGYETVRGRYRSRAIRLYVNFLTLPQEQLRPLLLARYVVPETPDDGMTTSAKGLGYVGLFGSQTGDWRQRSKEMLEQAGVKWFDPTDLRWNEISHENGDAKQGLIDDLVDVQHQGLRGAACVVYQLAATGDDGQPVSAPAARSELGFLAGRGIPTFVHIKPDVVGRNYLWAQIRLYPHMVRCNTLDKALAEAVRFMGGV